MLVCSKSELLLLPIAKRRQINGQLLLLLFQQEMTGTSLQVFNVKNLQKTMQHNKGIFTIFVLKLFQFHTTVTPKQPKQNAQLIKCNPYKFSSLSPLYTSFIHISNLLRIFHTDKSCNCSIHLVLFDTAWHLCGHLISKMSYIISSVNILYTTPLQYFYFKF